MKGKNKCKILKQIRQKIADENDIPYVTRECSYQGECKGTCPKCESELRYLEQELEKRRRLGKSVAVAAVAASLSLGLNGCVVRGENGSTAAPGNGTTQSIGQTQPTVPTESIEPLEGEPVAESLEPLEGEPVEESIEPLEGEPAVDPTLIKGEIDDTPPETELAGNIALPPEPETEPELMGMVALPPEKEQKMVERIAPLLEVVEMLPSDAGDGEAHGA